MSGIEKRLQTLDAAPSGSTSMVLSPQMTNKLPASSCKGYKVFVLSPSELANLGLTTKIENGKAVIMPAARVDISPENQIAERSLLPNIRCASKPDAVVGQAGSIAAHHSSVSIVKRSIPQQSSTQNLTAPVKVQQKYGRRIQSSAYKSRGTNSLLYSGHGILDTTPSYIEDTSSKRRPSNRRIIPMFAKHWTNSIKETGFVRCPLRACNYISLSFLDMGRHYAVCTGEPFDSEYTCNICKGRLNSERDFEMHILLSHSETSIKEEPVPVVACDVKTEIQKGQVLIRKRAYSKVHKVSWNIALEEKGYVSCFFKNCKFLALSLEEMIQHYRICNGSGSSASIECTICNGRVETIEKLTIHIARSHSSHYFQDVKMDNTTPVLRNFDPFMSNVGTSSDGDQVGMLQQLKSSTVCLPSNSVIETQLCGPSSHYTLSISEERTCRKQGAVPCSVQVCAKSLDDSINLVNCDNFTISDDRTIEMHSVLSGDPLVGSVNTCSEYSLSEQWGNVFEEQSFNASVYDYESNLHVTRCDTVCVKPENSSNSMDSDVHSLYSVYETEEDKVANVRISDLPKYICEDISVNNESTNSFVDCRRTYGKSSTMLLKPCRKTYGRKHHNITKSVPCSHTEAEDLDIKPPLLNINYHSIPSEHLINPKPESSDLSIIRKMCDTGK